MEEHNSSRNERLVGNETASRIDKTRVLQDLAKQR